MNKTPLLPLLLVQAGLMLAQMTLASPIPLPTDGYPISCAGQPVPWTSLVADEPNLPLLPSTTTLTASSTLDLARRFSTERRSIPLHHSLWVFNDDHSTQVLWLAMKGVLSNHLAARCFDAYLVRRGESFETMINGREFNDRLLNSGRSWDAMRLARCTADRSEALRILMADPAYIAGSGGEPSSARWWDYDRVYSCTDQVIGHYFQCIDGNGRLNNWLYDYGKVGVFRELLRRDFVTDISSTKAAQLNAMFEYQCRLVAVTEVYRADGASRDAIDGEAILRARASGESTVHGIEFGNPFVLPFVEIEGKYRTRLGLTDIPKSGMIGVHMLGMEQKKVVALVLEWSPSTRLTFAEFRTRFVRDHFRQYVRDTLEGIAGDALRDVKFNCDYSLIPGVEDLTQSVYSVVLDVEDGEWWKRVLREMPSRDAVP